MIAKKPMQDLSKGVRDDIDGEDNEESYYRWLEENPNAGRSRDVNPLKNYEDLGRYYERLLNGNHIKTHIFS